MAASIHVKPKGTWKKVKIDFNLLSNTDLESLVSFEELTDYELVKEGVKSTNKKLKKENKLQSGTKITNQKLKTDNGVKVGKAKKKKKKKGIQSGKDENIINNSTKSEQHEKEVKEQATVHTKQLSKQNKASKLVNINTEIVDVNKEIENKEKEEEAKTKKGKKRKLKGKTEIKADSKVKKIKLEDVNSKDDAKPTKKQVSKDMVLWKNLFVPEEVLLALRDSHFTTPTPIQALVLPHAIRDRLDIVGAAETGSGKTLAFGIPVINKILKHREELLNKETDGKAEEEMDLSHVTKQPIINESDSELEWESDGNENNVSDENYINSNASDENDNENIVSDENAETQQSDIRSEENEENEDEPSHDSDQDYDSEQGEFGCVTVIDDADFSSLGTESKEHSVLTVQHPLVLILEPTRELAVQVKNHLQAILKYTDIKVATIVGGMSMQKQQRVLKKCPDILVATPGRLWELFQMGTSYLVNIDQILCLVIDEADRMVEKGHFEELEKLCSHINKDESKKKKRQNFVFSATLTMIHVGPHRPTKKKRVKLTEAGKLESLIERIGLRGKPKVIDLSRKSGTVETLTEARINCSKEEKDLYLYYFLTQFPGRTLVFANSKDCIRRLVSIFTLLQTSPLPLHADMHQKQRLKNLERFTANPNSLLLASDVAARGLDIPNVQHVIHYQVPLTVENYVHRSGRTARASKEGISVMLIGPEDVKNYRKIIHTLNRSEDLPMIPVDYQFLPPLKQRLSLALKADVTEHRYEKKKRQNNWFVKAAQEMDMELDDSHLLNDLGDSAEQSQQKHQIKMLKQELNSLLQQPLTMKSFSGKYPTQTGKLMVPQQRKVENDAITCVKKDKKSQDKLMQQIQNERKIMQKSMEKKKLAKQSKRQAKKNRRKKNEKNKDV